MKKLLLLCVGLVISVVSQAQTFSVGNLVVSGTATFAIRPTFNGYTPWDSGNLNTALYATLASPAFTGVPTAPTASSGTNTTQLATTAFVTASPTINQPNLVGITNGGNANAGSIGEYVSATGNAISLTSGSTSNITSISLSAGDWDVWGSCLISPSVGVTGANAGVSISSGVLPSPPFYSSINLPTAGANQSFSVPMVRENVASTTTVYLTALASFSSGTATATCTIQARRMR